MSEAYEDFATETYTKVRADMAQALEGANGLPILLVSGEAHGDDSTLDKAIPDFLVEPAIAAAYTHLAAIKAAVDLVGAENVVLSLEQDQRNVTELKGYFDNVREDNALEQFKPLQDSQVRALIFAQENNVPIFGSDPLIRKVAEGKIGASDPERMEGEIKAIQTSPTDHQPHQKLLSMLAAQDILLTFRANIA